MDAARGLSSWTPNHLPLFHTSPLTLRTTTATTFVYVVKCNGQTQREMERLRGYQTLAFLFKRLKFWLNNVLQLVLLLAGFNNNPRHRAAITCRASFVGILAVRQWQDERDNVEHLGLDNGRGIKISGQKTKAKRNDFVSHLT